MNAKAATQVIAQEHKPFVRAYLLIKCLEDMATGWFGTTYVLFLLGKGLTPEQATQVNTVFMTVNFIVDLPTGALGDMIGQIPVYMAGLLILSGGFFIYGLGSSFWFFAVCEGASAVGSAFMSEALEALLVNKVGVDQAKVVFSKEGVYTRLATIPTTLLGSIIATKYGLQLPWFLASVTLLLALFVSVLTLRKYHTVRVDKLRTKTHFTRKFSRTIKVGVRRLLSTKQTRTAILITVVLAIATQAPNMFWTPILKQQADSIEWLGFLWIGISGAMALGSHIASKLAANNKILALLLVSIGIPLALVAILPKCLGVTIAVIVIHEIGRGAIGVTLKAYLNESIPNASRTTVNSAIGSIDRLARAVGLMFAGALSSRISLIDTWLVSGLILVGLAGILMALFVSERILNALTKFVFAMRAREQ